MSIALLVNRIEQELKQLQAATAQTTRLVNKIKQVEDEDIRDAIVAASALHMQSFYTGAERIFYEIAKTLDGDVPVGADWHKQLLEQMAVEIPTIRQAVISEQTLVGLDELRRFRHVVRSNYAYNLKAEMVMQLSQVLTICNQNLTHDITILINTMLLP